MAILKFYKREWDTFPRFWTKPMDPDKVEVVFRKLSRHFKLNTTVLRTTRYRGYAHLASGRIRLPKKEVHLGLICHELGHIRAVKLYGIKEGGGHTKKMWRSMVPIYRYAEKFLHPTYCEDTWTGNDYY